VEERQRSDKKKREEEDREWEPTWFKEITDEEGGSIWVFTGGYWEQKEEKIKCIKEGIDFSEFLNGGKSRDSATDFLSYPSLDD